MSIAETTDVAAADAYAKNAAKPGTRVRIFLYLSVLISLIGLGAPFQGLMATPISFFLKNKLHLSAENVALFGVLSSIPLYFSFVFGFVRDTWNPFGIRDRGYMMLFGLSSAALFAIFAFVPVSYGTLLAAVFLLTISFLFVMSAQSGLTSTVARQMRMSGQVSALWNTAQSLPVLVSFFLGGILSDQLEGDHATLAARILFLIGAAIMLTIALYAMLKPKAVFAHLKDEASGAPRLSDLKRLAKHWPIYPAMTIWFLWSFAPGFQTPLQFFLQNTLHGNDAAFGDWYAIFGASFIPTFLLYGLLCRRYSLRPLLFWTTLVGVPQAIPLLFVHSVDGALVAAGAMGLMGGMCSAAFLDLIIRSAPKGLEGATLMMQISFYFIAARFGDLLGTWLYQTFGGFGVCVIAITVVYASILGMLLLVPKSLTATTDGEAIEGA